jgi:predicted ATP-grasp superfamily ATP-dependent carboligase/thioredoxin reductase
MNGPGSAHAQIPAVIVGGSLNALGVVRSLSHAGVPVVVVETTRECPVAWSRHCRFIRTPSVHGEGLVSCLLSLAETLACRPVLLLTRDDSVATVSACRDRLSSAFHIDLPSAETVTTLANKAEFHVIASELGIPVPHGLVVRGEADLENIARLQPPLVIKPADPAKVLAGEIERIALAGSIAEARDVAVRLLTRASPLIIQQWVEGVDSDIYFTLFACNARSGLIGIFTGRKVVCSPPRIGSTAACVAAPEAAETLGRETLRIIEQFAYRGLGSIEFKRDQCSGRFFVIEPTVGRTDWQEEIATLCGMNLPMLAYRTALGQAAYAEPQGESGRIVWRESIGTHIPEGLVARRAKIIDGYFRWGDPMPALYHYGYERLALRVWRRVMRASSSSPRRITRVCCMDLNTTIIGAGPYGLSIAAHLRAKKIPYEMFGSPLESWRRFMPEGMILKSEPFASNLWDPARRYSLKRYFSTQKIPFQAVGRPVSLSRFLDYADWFRQNTIDAPDDVKIVKLRRVEGGFALELADGRRVTSRRVVLATGHIPFRIIPHEISHLPEPFVAHSCRIKPIREYAGCDVTIIGAGTSALETAALLHEAGARVRVVIRRERIDWNPPSKPRSLLARIRAPDAAIASGWGSLALSELPRVFRRTFAPSKRHGFVAGAYGPSGAWWLRDRVEGSSVEIWLGSRVEAASIADGGIRVRIARPGGTEEIATDHLISATGYRVDINRLDFLDPELLKTLVTEARGIPALSSTFETAVPGLFIVGVASSPVFGPVMRFMYGAKHAAPVIASRLRRDRAA